MAAKDLFHHLVREILEKEGWTITHDPYYLILQKDVTEYEIDLGAEKLLAAEKESEKIAVEIKSFTKSSLLYEFHSVLGQYMVYLYGLQKLAPERTLYLAIPLFAQKKIEKIPPLMEMIESFKLNVICFDEENKNIVSWKK